MLANEQVVVISIIMGCIPYLIRRLPVRGRQVLEIRALFWSVQYIDHRQWTVRIPLIERLRQAIWTIITHLHEEAVLTHKNDISSEV